MKASTKVVAGFFFAMAASATYKVLKSEQDQDKLKAKLDQVQGQVQDVIDKANAAVSPYVEQAKASYASSKSVLSDSISGQDEDAQPDIEIEEQDLDLEK
ncbi:hypothetical protein [Fructobacillus fructosus]|uniref:hypothetical protein n=1 Tax=Fructobacillus fructosus TaxID=1631 RepID=UPI00200A2B3C|nr:hypothetical protein [Fructobacillus fructosus]MCK8638521.1 hypothetical protein [Fructobacillus fructosus]